MIQIIQSSGAEIAGLESKKQMQNKKGHILIFCHCFLIF